MTKNNFIIKSNSNSKQKHCSKQMYEEKFFRLDKAKKIVFHILEHIFCYYFFCVFGVLWIRCVFLYEFSTKVIHFSTLLIFFRNKLLQ